MPETLSSPVPARPRYRALLAAVALMGALFATSAPLSAMADDTAVGSISGTVTTPDGQPAANIWVNVSIPDGQGTSFFASTITDGGGFYAFTELALDTYSLQLTAFGYQPYPGQSVTLTTEAPSSTVDIALQAYPVGDGSISGVVTADGSPLAFQYVSAANHSSGQQLSAFTDEFGAYEITGLANGAWQVSSFAGPGYQFLPITTIEISDTSPTATVDLAFLSWPTGTSSISGTVTDSATGTPLANVYVSLYGDGIAYQGSAVSDEAGQFAFSHLPAGSFTLNASNLGLSYLGFSQTITVLADETITADIALVAANSTITGHIKDKQGNPIADVYVNAHAEGGSFGDATTDENGNYEITNVGAVAYTLTVGGVGTPYKQKTKVVTPAANGTGTANFTLKPRTTGSLGGWVLVSETEVYSQPVCVTLYSSKNKKVVAETVTLGPDFGDGTYGFYDIKPGSYTVSFADCDDDPAVAFDTVFFGGATKYKDATFITVAAAQESYGNDHTIDFRTASSTVSGHVQKGNGTPLAGLTVTATDGAITATAVTDANGDYTITGLYTDRYVVSVGGAGTLYNAKQKNVNTVDNGDVTVNFSLSKKN
jgi:large repetitive protein